MSFDYDLFVIGGGSGGVRAARMAAHECGAKVALAEQERYGGTCVIRGCVPKKLMVFASEFSRIPDESKAYGWQFDSHTMDWSTFSHNLHSEIDRLEGVYCNLLAHAGVDCFDMRAQIKDSHTVELASGEQFTAKYILVATGGHPVRPAMPNAQFGMVSDDIFHLSELPNSILIVGGGYVACEFACLLNGLGVNVTQFYRGEQILRGFDNEARDLISSQMLADGVDVQVHANIDVMELVTTFEKLSNDRSQEGGTVSQELAGPKKIGSTGPFKVRGTNGYEGVFDKVFFAVGRSPNSSDLGLEDVGVALGDRGEIIVDSYSQTSVPSIFAVGDVTNRVNLTPVAIREATAFVETIFKAGKVPVDHELIPSAVFTQPELGSVGLSEERAAEQESIAVYSTSFKPMRCSFAGLSNKVLMKLVVSRSSHKVLGCTIVAPGAAEMIQFAGIAIKMGATKSDFDRTVAVHPTMSEEIVTMRHATRVS